MVDPSAIKVHAWRTLPGKNPRASPLTQSLGAARKQKARASRPGFFWNAKRAYQAAGLNSFDALALIGSTVSVAIF